jgi:hypothetical protein
MTASLRIRPLLSLILLALLILPLAAAAPTVHAQGACDDYPEPLTANMVGQLQDFYYDQFTGTQFWQTDFCQAADGVWADIAHGGPPPDGITPIDDPTFDTVATAAEWLADQSPVIAVELDGAARAYPLAILTRHEIVNDDLSGIPIAVTFCPLCNSAIVFDRNVGEDVLRFGVSGFLRNSDLIMWDNLTQSWWQQLTGEGIVGDYTGTQLAILPSQVVGFGAFAAQHPDGEVLSPGERSYGTNPYVEYDSGSPFGAFIGADNIDDRLPAMSRVLAGVIGGEPIAYPFRVLNGVQVINDTVGDLPVAAFWQPGAVSALDMARIDESRDVGMAALFSREVDGQTLTFRVDEDGTLRDEETGSTWNIFGEAIDGDLAGTQLTQQLAAPHFWFAWAAFQPDTAIYEPAE